MLKQNIVIIHLSILNDIELNICNRKFAFDFFNTGLEFLSYRGPRKGAVRHTDRQTDFGYYYIDSINTILHTH